MSANREGIKRLNDMIVDAQYAQQMGIKVFNGQASAEDYLELQKVADDLISEIQNWKSLIPNQHQ
jgi:hypothetical protein